MDLQWYPGHMTKAMRQMQDDLKLVDLIIELVDARIPYSSRNPDIDELGKNKARLLLLNKSDLAQDTYNSAWVQYFAEQNVKALSLNSKKNGTLKTIWPVIQDACKEKIARDQKKGIRNRPIRAMVVGIPNVGKSTFINSLAGKASTKTGNTPGVTKGKQWIRLNRQVELLDTPGVLWPKFEDEKVGEHLAFIGTIRDELVPEEELAADLITLLHTHRAGMIEKKYSIESKEDPYETLIDIAKRRGCIGKGSRPDTEKAARLFLDDFRGGRLGRVTLEYPEDL